MEATNFEESNMILSKPKGLSEDEVSSQFAFRGQLGNVPVYVTCFKTTQAELDEINRTGRVLVVVMGNSYPPLMVTGVNPIDPNERNPGT